jgi:hypothetical protein
MNNDASGPGLIRYLSVSGESRPHAVFPKNIYSSSTRTKFVVRRIGHSKGYGAEILFVTTDMTGKIGWYGKQDIHKWKVYLFFKNRRFSGVIFFLCHLIPDK